MVLNLIPNKLVRFRFFSFSAIAVMAFSLHILAPAMARDKPALAKKEAGREQIG